MTKLPKESLPQLYASMMREIKLRLDAIETAFQKAQSDIKDPQTILQCEFCYLQLRRCAEIVANATLLAHNGIVEFRNQKLMTEWKSATLFNRLAKLSDDAFPEPTIVSDKDKNGIADLHISSDAGENRKKLIKIHGLCAGKLHAGSLADLTAQGGKNYDLRDIHEWRNFFIGLLNTHAILMPDRKSVMVVFMRRADGNDEVSCEFLPIESVERGS